MKVNLETTVQLETDVHLKPSDYSRNEFARAKDVVENYLELEQYSERSLKVEVISENRVTDNMRD